MTRLPLLLGPDVPVHDAGLAAFCERWRRDLGADLVPERCQSVADLVARAGAVAGPGVVVDPGVSVDEALVAALDGIGMPVSLVSTRIPTTSPVDGENVFRIEGRGIGGYRWGALSVLRRAAWPWTRDRYGEDPEHVAELRLPEGDPPFSVVVLVHGGGWKDLWRRDIMEGLAVDLARAGYASWNVDFRRVGPSGGGWPMTFDDVAASVAALARHADVVDLERMALVGHSAGGQLVLAQAARRDALRPQLIVSLAGVVDVFEAARRGLVGGETIVHRLLGGTPDEFPDRYACVSPHHLVPLGVPQLLVQGLLDYIPDLVDLNRRYADVARAAGDDVVLLEFDDVDHMAPIDPRSVAWAAARERLDRALSPAAERVGA